MECLQNRRESFYKPVRVQNSSKTGAVKNIKWPHPDTFLANPTSLAEAGFFYNPSFDDRDNVSCFTCDKQLSDWEEEDDPFDIHWSKCAKSCCWAVVRCGLRQDLDSDGRFMFPDKNRIPTSKVMEKARLQTFATGDGWIHDQIRNHGAGSKKMAKAGFVFTPEHEGDDLATCLYCGICLSSWDTEDDPLEQHRKRKGNECPFFNPPTDEIGKARQTTGPSKPSSRTSTAPVRSHTRGRSRSGMREITEQPDESAQVNMKSTATRKPSRARKTVVAAKEEITVEVTKDDNPRSITKSATARKSSRSRKAAAKVEEEEFSQPIAEPEVEALPVTFKTNASRKSSRSRKTAIPVQEEEPRQLNPDSDPGSPPTTLITQKPSRSRKTVAPPVKEEKPQQPKPKPKSRSKSVARKTRLSHSPSPSPPPAQPVELDKAEDDELGPSKRPPRSKKVAAKQPEKADARQAEDSASIEEEDMPTKKSRTKGAVVSHSEQADLTADEQASSANKVKAKSTIEPTEVIDVHMEGTPEKPYEASNASVRHVGKDSEAERVEASEHPAEPNVPLSDTEIDIRASSSTVLEPAQSFGLSIPQPEPQTPAHNAPEALSTRTPTAPDANTNPQPVEEPAAEFIPYLSKLPFIPLHSLSEAELDMTVEEWIRYQIEVEYDKFKRDGERELLRFRKRSEEVRKMIEGL